MKEQNIQQVRKRWLAQDAAWLCRIRSTTRIPVPTYLISMIVFRTSEWTLRNPTRVEANCKSALGDTMFSRRLRILYRDLPEDLWKCESIFSFKQRLHNSTWNFDIDPVRLHWPCKGFVCFRINTSTNTNLHVALLDYQV